MKVQKPTIIEEELEITGVTLLSTEEAEKLPSRLRKYKDWWWLRSPGAFQSHAAIVDYFGSVFYYGNYVNGDDVCVRPALQISNFDSSTCQIGDVFIFDNKEFEIISKNFAFCKSDIGRYWFRENWETECANDYEKLDIKKFVDKWFKEVIEENKNDES